MPTPFAAVDDAVSAAIDGEFGEQFTFVAYKSATDVNSPLVADVARPNLTVTGVWEGIADAEFPRSRGDASDDDAMRRVGAYASVSVANDALTWRPRRGDRCVRVHTNKTYEVDRAMNDDMGRTLFILGAK